MSAQDDNLATKIGSMLLQWCSTHVLTELAALSCIPIVGRRTDVFS
jgi:hypothetical protein